MFKNMKLGTKLLVVVFGGGGHPLCRDGVSFSHGILKRPFRVCIRPACGRARHQEEPD